MNAEDLGQRSIAALVLWCRQKRDALTKEHAHFQLGILSFDTRKSCKPVIQSSVIPFNYLQLTIEQQGRLIAAYSTPNDQGK